MLFNKFRKNVKFKTAANSKKTKTIIIYFKFNPLIETLK